MLDQAETYAEARNCLAHTYGLQTSPAFAEELLDFAELLIKQAASTAAQLMTRTVRTVPHDAPLAQVRALVVRDGFGRLPVVGRSGRILGLLTERDLVVAQHEADHGGAPVSTRTAADLLPADALERVAFVAPGDPRDIVVERLRRPGVVACLVTHSGVPDQRLLGIITHADLLYRM
jgi:CBS domain-containing protein